MTNTENLEALETRIQNWIEKQNKIAKEIQYELNAIEREERDIDFGKIRKLAYEADVYETFANLLLDDVKALKGEPRAFLEGMLTGLQMNTAPAAKEPEKQEVK